MDNRLSTGLGFDAHRFASDSRPLFLATLQWEGQGIEGDSDGDVVVHALIDACCAAAGLGDIGSLFGVGPQSLGSGMRGDAMLSTVADMLRSRGCTLRSASVVVVGNRPKVGPRRVEAQQALGTILHCPVSLTATTTDGMGFTGHGEGIAAMANVLMDVART